MEDPDLSNSVLPDMTLDGSQLAAMSLSELDSSQKKKARKGLPSVARQKLIKALNEKRNKPWTMNSFLNSSVTKRTLKSNNRDLANLLQKKKRELQGAQDVIVSQQEELQNLRLEISKIQNNNQEAINAQVEKRMQDERRQLQSLLISIMSSANLALDVVAPGLGHDVSEAPSKEEEAGMPDSSPDSLPYLPPPPPSLQTLNPAISMILEESQLNALGLDADFLQSPSPQKQPKRKTKENRRSAFIYHASLATSPAEEEYEAAKLMEEEDPMVPLDGLASSFEGKRQETPEGCGDRENIEDEMSEIGVNEEVTEEVNEEVVSEEPSKKTRKSGRKVMEEKKEKKDETVSTKEMRKSRRTGKELEEDEQSVAGTEKKNSEEALRETRKPKKSAKKIEETSTNEENLLEDKKIEEKKSVRKSKRISALPPQELLGVDADSPQRKVRQRRGTFVVTKPKEIPRERRETFAVAAPPPSSPPREINETDMNVIDMELTQTIEGAGIIKGEEAPPMKKKKSALPVPITEDSSSSDESSKAKFTAFMAKPGKMVFTAGRRDLGDIFKKPKSRSKQKMTLPKPPRSRSKRKVQEKPASQPKSVYDLSMEESMVEMPTKKVGPQKADVPLPSKFNERMQEVGKGEPSGLAESPHGIMLVLGTGKRTKPRSKQKNVHYPQKKSLSQVHQVQDESGLDSSDSDGNAQRKDSAGHTPVRREASRKQSSPTKVKGHTDSLAEAEVLRVPLSPKTMTPPPHRMDICNTSIFSPELSSSELSPSKDNKAKISEKVPEKINETIEICITADEGEKREEIGKENTEEDSKKAKNKKKKSRIREVSVSNCEIVEGKRSRRTGSCVNYKEPSLTKKMRRDPNAKV